jgi:beta-glucosidase
MDWYMTDEDSLVPLPEPVKTQYIDESRLFSYPGGIMKKWTLKLNGYLKLRERDCKFKFGLTAAGQAKVTFSCNGKVTFSCNGKLSCS